jgi:hypothetical protein
VRHIFCAHRRHRLDVCALVEELVDEAEVAELRRQVEGGIAILRWGSGEAV